MKPQKLLQKHDFSDLFTRISERLGHQTAIHAIAEWLTRHTKLAGKPWSFDHHEFQLAICNDSSPHVCVQKPTQVGLTELSLRTALALCGIRQHFALIYVMPSAHFASEVGKTRVDPIIESSERLTQMLISGANGAMMKRLGTCTFYMGGAASKTQAISRPVQALFFDEKDFCNQSVLTAYHGRLRHVLEEDRIIREFSTPTVSDYGISLALEKSSHQRYMCKCTHCGKRQAPEFKTQVTIPGWGKDSFEFFSKDDLVNPDIDVASAYLRCIKCGKDLLPALLKSATREWVATHPGRLISGYAVKPFDLVKFNTIPSLVRAFGNYSDEADYWNFVQGEVFASDTNQVNIELMAGMFSLDALDLDSDVYDLCLGIDVGATYCYAVAGRRVRGADNMLRTQVVWRKRYYVQNGAFLAQISTDMDKMKPLKVVIDIGPDATLSKGIRDYGPGWCFAASYVNDSKSKLEYFTPNENGVVQLQRTKGFTSMVKEMNDGRWSFSMGPDKNIVLQHLAGMKRVNQAVKDAAEVKPTWVKVGDGEDHYLHACMYMKTALDLLDSIGDTEDVPVLPSIAGVTLSSKVAPISSDAIRDAIRMLGFSPMQR